MPAAEKLSDDVFLVCLGEVQELAGKEGLAEKSTPSVEELDDLRGAIHTRLNQAR